ncbi:MAG: methyltransferase domain-containing protein [Bacteroidetes bacterium]|nr:methyltransferase domain-containing protein [Bacteroidota bacterium]
MAELNETYWTNRYLNAETAWDVGSVSTPLKEYFEQLTDKNIRILIPGCGNGYEAEHLWNLGFTEIYVADLSAIPLDQLKSRNPEIDSQYFLKTDFFELQETFDLIIEQTFFCAISPNLRRAYAQKSASLLADGGKLVGVLFDREFSGGPPFGGEKEEYKSYFAEYFKEIYVESCYNSIKPRQDSELFMICKK